MNIYLIWSNEHRQWWGPARCGYVARIEEAGRYSHAEALDICKGAMPGARGGVLPELPVRLEDAQLMCRAYEATYRREFPPG